MSKITFVLPTSVPAVISLLRQQALFNTVLLSCLRPSSLTGNSSAYCATDACRFVAGKVTVVITDGIGCSM